MPKFPSLWHTMQSNVLPACYVLLKHATTNLLFENFTCSFFIYACYKHTITQKSCLFIL